MRLPLGRDLRAVRHGKQLCAGRKTRKALANRRGNCAANAAVDFIEDNRGRSALFGQCDFQRQNETRQFPARRDLRQGRKRRTGVGRNQKLNAVHAISGPAVFGQSLHRRLKLGSIKL